MPQPGSRPAATPPPVSPAPLRGGEEQARGKPSAWGSGGAFLALSTILSYATGNEGAAASTLLPHSPPEAVAGLSPLDSLPLAVEAGP